MIFDNLILLFLQLVNIILSEKIYDLNFLLLHIYKKEVIKERPERYRKMVRCDIIIGSIISPKDKKSVPSKKNPNCDCFECKSIYDF